MKEIIGGVTAPKGFMAAGVHCGIRKNKQKRDLALIYSENISNAVAVYTQNLVKGAPLMVTKQNLTNGKAQAVICNSGNANTCNANGVEIANEVCNLLSNELKVKAENIIIASTGVIGQPLEIEPFKTGIPCLVKALGKNSDDASEAIMTTDTKMKSIAFEFMLDGKVCRIGGIAKGSGMIAPNMATMLVFLTTDVAINATMLQLALQADVEKTFNMLSIDGDTSTNDMLSIMANGQAGNCEITAEGDAYNAFVKALNKITVTLCKMIAKDGEGATKLLQCCVAGALDKNNAVKIAKAVINSPLVKTAMFGADANWGRVLCAIGYSGAKTNVNKIDVSFKSSGQEIIVCQNGAGVAFDEAVAKKLLLNDEIIIKITCSDGAGSATSWGCDLTYDYVKINGDYRT